MRGIRRSNCGLPARLLEAGWLPPIAAARALDMTVDELHRHIRAGALRIRRFGAVVLVEVPR